jgi:DtxR family Mn-dependent transcriptional regulator
LVPDARTYLTDRGAIRLRDAPPGHRVTILLVSEVVEDEEQLIAYLHARGLTPGTDVVLGSCVPELGSCELRVGDRSVTVPERVVRALWVVPHQ